MGYRSEVHIAVSKKDEAKLDAIMNKHKLLCDADKETVDRGWSTFIKVNYEDYAVYHGNWLKWYPEYEDVKAITNFLEEDETGEDRLMLCIGEDNTIHSEVGDYWDVFCVSMMVHVDLDNQSINESK